MTENNHSGEIPVVTIDGPSGVGKGTTCIQVAKLTGWQILDSGSLYRITALKALDEGVMDDESRLVEIARNLDVAYLIEDTELKIMLDGQDVTTRIRDEKTGQMASKIAVLAPLREALLDRQRRFAVSPGLVADGRDMGTVVFPDARVKIFLTASTEERAKRRYKQLKDKEISANLANLVNELQERDERDSKRAVAPLKAADDAVVIDTTHLTISEVTEQVMSLIKLRFDN